MTSGNEARTGAGSGSAATRAALLAAARELFAAHGFDRTTVRAIADRAGVNQALLFRYYGSKDALFAAALAEPARALAAQVPPDELLASALHRIVPLDGTSDDADALLALLRSPGRSPATTALRDELAAPYRRAFTSLAARGEADPDGGGDTDAGLRADLLLAWLLGIAFARAVLEVPTLVEADAGALVAHVERAAASLLDTPAAPPQRAE